MTGADSNAAVVNAAQTAARKIVEPTIRVTINGRPINLPEWGLESGREHLRWSEGPINRREYAESVALALANLEYRGMISFNEIEEIQ